ncbi:flavoprotein [Wenjunlia tyrosinilytica]|uniref:Flavoprotein n=1 Tax=Wenjunlia tyrosinilytica TaxID=1544741 RepID=A0A917ZJS0_9ACTN|nr:flavoprotein [Wenjunlia tyrosinilytica]
MIICGAGPAVHADQLVAEAHKRQWDVHVITTPVGRDFVDVEVLEKMTGHPVRSDYHRPGHAGGRSLPEAAAIVVAPATYNTINKWALGVSDNYALGILAEALALGTPIAVLPFMNAALSAHPAYLRNVELLRGEGVCVLQGDGHGPEPHPPGAGGQLLPSFPWGLALDAVETAH